MPPAVRIVVALPAEAKPINQRFGLIRDNSAEAFPLYRNDRVALVVSGPGAEQAQQAVRWLAAYLPTDEETLWVNLGIAGHPHRPLGEALLAERLSSERDDPVIHAVLPRPCPCDSAPLVTLAEPDFDYHRDAMIDMEGFGFYRAAVDFSPPEKVQCLKIISDNRQQDARNINSKMVRKLIEQHLVLLENLVEAMAGPA
ncbi:MAG: hypothetical protein ABW088_04640 [Sedimenticola sp.]